MMTETQRILDTAVLAGELLLKNGAEIFRVQDTVCCILKAYGIGDYNVYIISNGIFVSVNENKEDFCSAVRHVPLGKVHLGNIAEANQVSREICDGSCTLERARERLDEIIYPNGNEKSHLRMDAGMVSVEKDGPRRRSEDSPWLLIPACGMGSACFCYLFGGSPYDSFLAFFLGVILQVFLLGAGKQRISKFISSLMGSFIVTIGSAGIVYLGLNASFDKMVIGAIIPLVPGVAFTNSIREFFNGDYLSGSIHLIDALLSGICIALGVGLGINLFKVLTGGAFL